MKYAIHKCDFEDEAMVRWVMQLIQYYFDIEFVSGDKNSFVDMLSREFLSEHSILALSCHFIRRSEDSVQIETPSGWITYDLESSLLDLDEEWFPLKEIRHRMGIPYYWIESMHNEMNTGAIAALNYLEHIGSIVYVLQKSDEDEELVESYHITFRCLSNYLSRLDFDEDRQKDTFYEGMNLQNYTANLFYSM